MSEPRVYWAILKLFLIIFIQSVDFIFDLIDLIDLPDHIHFESSSQKQPENVLPKGRDLPQGAQ